MGSAVIIGGGGADFGGSVDKCTSEPTLHLLRDSFPCICLAGFAASYQWISDAARAWVPACMWEPRQHNSLLSRLHGCGSHVHIPSALSVGSVSRLHSSYWCRGSTLVSSGEKGPKMEWNEQKEVDLIWKTRMHCLFGGFVVVAFLFLFDLFIFLNEETGGPALLCFAPVSYWTCKLMLQSVTLDYITGLSLCVFRLQVRERYDNSSAANASVRWTTFPIFGISLINYLINIAALENVLTLHDPGCAWLISGYKMFFFFSKN